MKKTISIGIIAFAAILIAFTYKNNTSTKESAESNGKGINFHSGTWEEALVQAKKENKLIFLDVYASWCGPCKKLKSNTFTDESVGTYYNANFINVSLDAEKGEGISVASKYSVNQYPTLLFINSEGVVVKQTAGYHNSNQFISLGKSVSKP